MSPKFHLLGLFLLIGLLIINSRGRREPDDLAFVVALGLDRGKGNLLAMTVQIAVPRAFAQAGGGGGGGGGAAQKPVVNNTIEAPSVFGALAAINTYTDRQLNLMHVQAIVFGSSLAREGVGRYIGVLSRYREIRQNMLVLVARGSAKSFIDALSSRLEISTSKYLQLVGENGLRTGRSLPRPFHYFVSSSKSRGEMPIAQLVGVQKPKKIEVPGEGKPSGSFKPAGQEKAGDLPRQGDVKTEFLGTALFDGDRMVGELNGAETLFLSILRGELKRASYTVKDPKRPNYVIPMDLTQRRKPEVKVHRRRGEVGLTVRCRLYADILAIQSGINYEAPRMSRYLERNLSAQFTRRAQEVLAKLQRLGADAAAVGDHVRSRFLTEPAWEKYNWLARFSKTPIKVTVEVELRRAGLILKMFPILERQREKQGVPTPAH